MIGRGDTLLHLGDKPLLVVKVASSASSINESRAREVVCANSSTRRNVAASNWMLAGRFMSAFYAFAVSPTTRPVATGAPRGTGIVGKRTLQPPPVAT